jgi:hypothetical protein
MRYHLMTLACFAAAASLWYFGMRDNAGLLIAAAGLTELLGWKRLFKGRTTG